MNIRNSKMTLFLVLILVAFISGCASKQTRTKSSIVDYLYPKESVKVVEPSIPLLNIPIKVGIAFVPEQSAKSRWARNRGARLTEINKANLLEKVASHFREYNIVSDIEVIPSAYLTPGGGFSNLEQIKTMYGTDVIALVSYDQAQFTDKDFLSLTYWTLIGAYIVSGEKNDTSTMLDTAVYDIASRKMLFRAPGTSNVKGRATPINLSEELRADSLKSFEEASEKMTDNLVIQLSSFREKIKRNPEQVKVVYRKGYSGGGSFGLFEIAILLLIVATTIAKKSNKKNSLGRLKAPLRSAFNRR
ncbi:MAG: rhombotarget lipoprotein [Gammaproteobacteria bacterium]|nr:rhombotarget lipoprotein [Gammaproteobacteria bacterium]